MNSKWCFCLLVEIFLFCFVNAKSNKKTNRKKMHYLHSLGFCFLLFLPFSLWFLYMLRFLRRVSIQIRKSFIFFSLKTRDWLQLIKRKQKKIGNSSSVLNFRFTYRSISSSFSLGVLFILRIMIDRWCHSFLCTDKKQKIQINKQQSN